MINTSTEKYLIEQIEKGRTPSVQYYFFNKDHILRKCCIGTADFQSNRKVNEFTTYHAYSVTKTFTALAVLQLAERGILNISHPIKKYLYSFPYAADITICHVLSHSAGIPNPIPLSWIHLAADHKEFDRNRFFEAVFQNHPRISFRSNDKFFYSNLGYILLGQLIEAVSLQSYEHFVTENIVNKLTLDSTDIGFQIPDQSNHATGYHKTMSFTNLVLGLFLDKKKFMKPAEGRWKAFKHFYVNGTPYGGLIGKPVVFVKYVQELLNPDSSLLSAHYKQMLFKENYTNGNNLTGMCLSWFKGSLNGRTYYCHAGGGGGYYCEIRIYPEHGVGSIVFFNRTGMNDERYLDRLDREYLD